MRSFQVKVVSPSQGEEIILINDFSESKEVIPKKVLLQIIDMVLSALYSGDQETYDNLNISLPKNLHSFQKQLILISISQCILYGKHKVILPLIKQITDHTEYAYYRLGMQVSHGVMQFNLTSLSGWGILVVRVREATHDIKLHIEMRHKLLDLSKDELLANYVATRFLSDEIDRTF